MKTLSQLATVVFVSTVALAIGCGDKKTEKKKETEAQTKERTAKEKEEQSKAKEAQPSSKERPRAAAKTPNWVARANELQKSACACADEPCGRKQQKTLNAYIMKTKGVRIDNEKATTVAKAVLAAQTCISKLLLRLKMEKLKKLKRPGLGDSNVAK